MVYASCRDDELSMEDEFGSYFTKDFINSLLDEETPVMLAMDSNKKREIFEKSYSSPPAHGPEIKQHPQAWEYPSVMPEHWEYPTVMPEHWEKDYPRRLGL